MLILWHWSEKGFVRFSAKEIKALFVYSSMAEWSILSFFCWYKSECEKVVLFSFRASYFGRIVQMWLNAILNCTTALFIAHKSTFCVVNVKVILNGERFFLSTFGNHLHTLQHSLAVNELAWQEEIHSMLRFFFSSLYSSAVLILLYAFEIEIYGLLGSN